jgi:para-aminobenzoate synthetase component 1
MSLIDWYWRAIPLQNKTGAQVFQELGYQREAIATLLESPYPTPTDQPQLCQYSICAGAPRIMGGSPQLWTPKIGKILPFLRNLLERKTSTGENIPHHLPFVGGWLGWLGYDLAWEIEKLPYLKADSLTFPVAYWYEPHSFAILDHRQQILWLASTTPEDLELRQSLIENGDGEDWEMGEFFSSAKPPLFLSSQGEYEAAVRQAKQYIKAGDIFQANLSLRFQATTRADSWKIYRTLQKINPSPFASYWKTPWGVVISCSPERLIQLQGNQAQTRPIAGTRPRGANSLEEEQLTTELLTNVKERAEHIMLVDLERNDLGRVCEWGSVQVDELLTIERYSHVMHLVSNITGKLNSDCHPVDLIRAVFPGGTITGCPKVRCLEIIEELEPVRRSLFYGSCGYLNLGGNLDLNILIRTLLLTPSGDRASEFEVWGQVGAGIVADSDPEKEWDESLHKAQAQLTALHLNCTEKPVF